MSEASALTTTLGPDEIASLVGMIAEGQQPHAGKALRTLREAAGVTLNQLAKLFHRKAPTVCGWEQGNAWPRTPDLLPGMLHSLGVPPDAIAKAFVDEIDGDLDSRLYVRGDPTMIEFGYFLKTRGKVLQRVTIEAARGSAHHIAIYERWMLRNEQAVAGRESKSERKVELRAQDWTKRALQAPKEHASMDSIQEPDTLDVVKDESSDVSNNRQDESGN